jgi:hypothetical protein
MAQAVEQVPDTAGRRRAVGAVGVGYVLLSGVENIDFQHVPPVGAGPAAITAYYAGTPGLALTGWLGALALGAYAAFVAGLVAALPEACRTRWATLLMLAGGVAGPVLACVSVAARSALAAGTATGSPALVTTLQAVYLDGRALAGIFIGLTLIGAATAVGWMRPPLPAWLCRAALPVGVWTVLASGAAFTGATVVGWLAFAGFAADALWVAAVAVCLLLPADVGGSRPDTLAWVTFLLVAVAAGVSGLMLVVAPGRTGTFFSWPLAPPELAAVIGASYLVAAAGYGTALAGYGRRRRRTGRIMLAGIMALSAPVFVVTLADLAIFDLGRWQAVAWVALFGLFPLVAAGTLWWGRGGDPVGRRPSAPRTALLLAYSAVAIAGAVLLWWRPQQAARWAPVSEFGGRVLAGWLVLAATLAVLAVVEPVADSLPARLVVALQPVAWWLAGLRAPASFADHTGWLGYCLLLAVLGVAGGYPRPGGQPAGRSSAFQR